MKASASATLFFVQVRRQEVSPMLSFFRTYQRYFFFFIAIVIVISFSFFGTHATLGSAKKQEDYSIGLACDGSQMKRREIDDIMRFISTDSYDGELQKARRMPNFLNPGVIRKDFFSTGLAVILAEHHFKAIEKDFRERVTQHKNYRPYEHPSAPFIGVASLLGEILPKQKSRLDRFLADKKEVTPETFSLLVDLYLEEQAFPSSILRQYLMFQQKQYHWIEPDPHLAHINLNLFYCTSLEEWFGQNFIELIAQFIHNTAIIAREKGYHVSREEARFDLQQNGYRAFKSQTGKNVVDQKEFTTFFKNQLFYLQLDEKQAVGVWQKVMLMRRFFEDCASVPLFDAYQYRAFHSYASKTAFVDFYQLQPSMRLKDFSSLLELIFYLDIVGKAKGSLNDLPLTFKTMQEIEKKYPELIQKRYLVEMARVTQEEVALHIPIKKIWEWQLKKENFRRLQKRFKFVRDVEEDNQEKFFMALEDLTSDQRKEVEAFSRTLILSEFPELIEKALNEKSLETQEIVINSKGNLFFIEGIKEGAKLEKLLDASPFKEEVTTDKCKISARKKLECYYQDKKSFFRFYLLDRDKEKNIMTFEEAKKSQVLEILLEKVLENHYRKIRVQNPLIYQNKSGSWKAFEEVKNEVGKDLYTSLFKAIDQDVIKDNHALTPERLIDLNSFYPDYFFYGYMYRVLKEIQREGKESHYVIESKQENQQDTKTLSKQKPLKEQFSLIFTKKIHKNYEKNPFFDETLFTMVEKGWSSIRRSKKEGLAFFQLQEKRVPEESYLSEIEKGRLILGTEAKRFLMHTLLKRLKERGGIHLMRQQDAQ